MTEPALRDKDRSVLQKIEEGFDDVQKITEETTLENHHVTYAFQKLEDLGLIQVEKPGGMVERTINGQKRVFQAPKKAELTEEGEMFIKNTEQENSDEYEDLSHRELVEKVHQLDNEVQEIQRKFKLFKQQVLNQIQ